MKYYLKALNTNNRDLRTALLFTIQENNYLFSCPDGFQRVANAQKMKFGKIKHVFLPSLHPDYFAGFPGFFLSAREAMNAHADEKSDFGLMVVGPENVRDKMSLSTSFTGDYYTHLDVFEMPHVVSELVNGVEEAKDEEVKGEEMVVDSDIDAPSK